MEQKKVTQSMLTYQLSLVPFKTLLSITFGSSMLFKFHKVH